jgi:hypothetical protein
MHLSKECPGKINSFSQIQILLKLWAVVFNREILPLIVAGHFKEMLQLALAKRHFAYNLKFPRRQYRARPNRNSLIIVPQFPHHACTMVKSPIKESNDGLPCEWHYEFISWKPVILKSPIDFNHPTLLIKLIRIMGFHHPQPENTQAGLVDNALCLKIANK